MKYTHKKEEFRLFYDIIPPTYNPDLTLQPTLTGSKQGLIEAFSIPQLSLL